VILKQGMRSAELEMFIECGKMDDERKLWRENVKQGGNTDVPEKI
jgi:hypothetical protein